MTSYSGQTSDATAVDLSRLPYPDVIEALSFEGIVDALKTQLIQLAPEVEPVLGLESEPLVKLIQLFAYREMLLRQRVNDSAKAVNIAYAMGADLDNLVAILGVQRLLLQEADEQAQTPAVYESDEDLRQRALLAPEGYSVAGPAGAYVFHARTASGDVLDASAVSPNPGEVLVTVLARGETGVPDQALLDLVEAAVSAEDVRPLTDMVTVQAADVLTFTVEATIATFAGPDSSVVMTEAHRRLDAYLTGSFRLGRDITRAGLIAALCAEGVQNVVLAAPAADIPVTRAQAARCTLRDITHTGVGE